MKVRLYIYIYIYRWVYIVRETRRASEIHVFFEQSTRGGGGGGGAGKYYDLTVVYCHKKKSPDHHCMHVGSRCSLCSGKFWPLLAIRDADSIIVLKCSRTCVLSLSYRQKGHVPYVPPIILPSHPRPRCK